MVLHVLTLLLAMLAASIPVLGQTRTRIVDTVNNPSTGTPASTGTITLEISALCTAPGGFISAGRVVAPISISGGVDVQLIPNDTCVPANTTYRATYRLNNGADVYVQTWYVPTSGSTLSISSVATSPPPLPSIQIPISQLTGCAVNQTLISNGGSFICGIPLLNPMTALGDLTYGGVSGAITRLPGNTSISRRFLRQVGNGTISAAPVWDSLQSNDLPTPPGLLGLTSIGVIPRVSSSGVLGNTKLVCTDLNPVTCEMFDDTASTGWTQFKIRGGAGQGGQPLFRFHDSTNSPMAIVGADGGYATYVGGIIKASLTQNLLQLSSDAGVSWKGVADLVSPNPFEINLRRYGAKRLYIYDDTNSDLFHLNGVDLSIGFGPPLNTHAKLRRSGTALQARLGDDSGYGDFHGRDIVAFGSLMFPLKSDPAPPTNGEGWINGPVFRYRSAGITYETARLDAPGGRLLGSQLPFNAVDTTSDMTMGATSHINQAPASWTPPIRTFATGTGFTQLPTASGANVNRVYMVLDTTITGSKCLTGGSTITWCRSNGTDYDALSGAGGGGGGSGEANTASNLAGGIGLFSSKVGVDLRFKSLLALSNKLSVAANTNTVDIDLIPANVTITSLGGWPSGMTTAELGRLQGVTGPIQTQLDDKVGGAANLSTVGGVPFVNSAGVLNIDATKLFWNNSTKVLSVASQQVDGQFTIAKAGTVLTDNSSFLFETIADQANANTTALYLYPKDTNSHRMYFGKATRGFYALNFANVSGFENLPVQLFATGASSDGWSLNGRNGIAIGNTGTNTDLALVAGTNNAGYITGFQGTAATRSLRFKSWAADADTTSPVANYLFDTNVINTTLPHTLWRANGSQIGKLTAGGDLTFRRIQLSTASGSACDSGGRFTFEATAGGAGVADTVRLCAKTSADTYVTKDLLIGTTVVVQPNQSFTATTATVTAVHNVLSTNIVPYCETSAGGSIGQVAFASADSTTTPGTTVITFAKTDSLRRCVINASGGQPTEFTKVFSTPAASWTITAAEHNFGDDDFDVAVFVDDTTQWTKVTTTCYVVKATKDATCAFSRNMVGKMRAFKGGGTGSGGAGGGGGITSLNGLIGATQTFVNDTNVAITSTSTTHTLGWVGQLSVARGGTGASTAAAARTNLLPSKTGNANLCLKVASDETDWTVGACGTGGSNGTGEFTVMAAWNPTSIAAGGNQTFVMTGVTLAQTGMLADVGYISGMLNTCPMVDFAAWVSAAAEITIYARNFGGSSCDPNPATNIPIWVTPIQ